MIKENQRNHSDIMIDFETYVDWMRKIRVEVFENLTSIYMEGISSIFPQRHQETVSSLCHRGYHSKSWHPRM